MTGRTRPVSVGVAWHEPGWSRWLDVLFALLALAVLIGALGGIYDWLESGGPRNLFGAGSVPIAFNKAVALALVAGALLMHRIFPRIAMVATLCAAAIAGLTMFEYIFRSPLGIDEAAIDQYLPTLSGTPGRMSFSSAAALILASGGLAGMIRWPTSAVAAAFALAGSVVAACLVLAGYRYLTLQATTGFYSPLTAVAPQGLLLMSGLCASLAVTAVRALFCLRPLRVDHYMAWSTTVLIGLVLVFWQQQEQSDWAQRGYETRLARDAVISNLSVELVGRGVAQQRLANRWAIYGAPTEVQWMRDAQALLSDYQGIFAIAYVGTDRVVRWRVARDGVNAGFIGRSLDRDPDRRAAFKASAQMNAVRVTPSIDLLSGKRGNVFFTPIFENGTLVGHIVSSITSDELITLSRSGSTAGFNIYVHDAGGKVAGSPPSKNDLGIGVRQTGSFVILGQTWTVEVWPTAAYLAERRSNISAVTLGLGLIGVILVGAAFAQTRFSLLHRSRAEELSQRLATTLEAINEGFVTINPDWTVTFANRKAGEILGWDIHDIKGRSMVDLSLQFAGSPAQAMLTDVIERQESACRVFLRPNGQQWLEVTAHPVREGVALYLRDVTAERDRDNQLRLLEAAVARQNDILIITEIPQTADAPPESDNSRIIYVNEAFTRLTGYSRDEVMGKSARLLQGPRTSRAELAKVAAALHARHPVRVELINYTKDGQEYWIELDIVSLADASGRYTHHVAVERDITARKRAEEASAVMDERFQQVVAATNGVIWDVDLATRTVWYNDTVRSAFGYDPEIDIETLQHWEELIHPDDRARVARKAEAALSGTGNTLVDEYRLRKADGSYAFVTDRARIIRDAEGRAIRMVGAMVDETERHEIDLRLRQAQRLETVGLLTGGVAHDFNNLLTVILGNAEMLSDRLQDRPALRDMADMTVRAASRGADLTNRLLAFARRQPLDPRQVDVRGLLAGMKDLLDRTLPEAIRLTVASGADCWPIIVDPAQLESAVLNLVLNARDATPCGGTIEIGAGDLTLSPREAARHAGAAPGDFVEISVTDTGVGMTPEVLSRALEPFFTTKEPGKGTGLGLSMVYGFVRQSGGFMRIVSAPGKGTQIGICFPRAIRQGAAPALAADKAETMVGGSEHILVVEDDPMVRENVSNQLALLGYAVSVAASGTAALAMLSDGIEVDLLFTDVVMPGGLGGLDLAKAAQALRPDLPVLFTSGYSDALLNRDGRLEPGVQLLGKPYQLGDLARKIRAVIDAQHDGKDPK